MQRTNPVLQIDFGKTQGSVPRRRLLLGMQASRPGQQTTRHPCAQILQAELAASQTHLQLEIGDGRELGRTEIKLSQIHLHLGIHPF